MIRFFCRTLLLASGGIALATACLNAQTALYVSIGHNQWLTVRDSDRDRPVVRRNGQLMPLGGWDFQYLLREVPEFAPGYVSIRNEKIEGEDILAGQDSRQGFHFSCEFASAFELDHAFVVLEVDVGPKFNQLYLRQLGTLQPHHPKRIYVAGALFSAHPHFVLHVYTGGREVLNGQMTDLNCDHILDQMVAKRIAGVQDAPLQAFVGPEPEYPPELVKSKPPGSAKIRVHVSETGRVTNAELVAATDPAFGRTALDSIRMWHFLPQVRAGAPIAGTAEMAFQFEYNPTVLMAAPLGR
jgi:TonB family protein